MSEHQAMLDQITPLILTYNEAANIERTLAPLAWAKEIVVIDSGSDDGTLDILALRSNVRIIHRQFDSFADQCNFGLSHIHSEWVLSIDADYELSKALIGEIAKLDPHSTLNGFETNFIYRVFGKPLRATVYPPRICLFRRQYGTYWNEGHAHRLQLDGDTDRLDPPIFHDDRKPIDRWFRSQIAYARREADFLLAQPLSEQRRTQRLRHLIWLMPIAMPLYILFARGCILDGRPGIYYALQRAFAELALSITLLDRRLRRL